MKRASLSMLFFITILCFTPALAVYLHPFLSLSLSFLLFFSTFRLFCAISMRCGAITIIISMRRDNDKNKKKKKNVAASKEKRVA